MRGRVCVVAPPIHRRTGRQHAGIRGGLAGLKMGENLFYISLANHKCCLEYCEAWSQFVKISPLVSHTPKEESRLYFIFFFLLDSINVGVHSSKCKVLNVRADLLA